MICEDCGNSYSEKPPHTFGECVMVLRRRLEDARNSVLEEAAKVAEQQNPGGLDRDCGCAAAIRKLKTE